MEDDVPEDVKKDRNRRFLAASDRVALGRLSKHVGSRRRTFVEAVGERAPSTLLGRTIHGIPVAFEGPADLVGGEIDVEITGATAHGLAGTR